MEVGGVEYGLNGGDVHGGGRGKGEDGDVGVYKRSVGESGG